MHRTESRDDRSWNTEPTELGSSPSVSILSPSQWPPRDWVRGDLLFKPQDWQKSKQRCATSFGGTEWAGEEDQATSLVALCSFKPPASTVLYWRHHASCPVQLVFKIQPIPDFPEVHVPECPIGYLAASTPLFLWESSSSTFARAPSLSGSRMHFARCPYSIFLVLNDWF